MLRDETEFKGSMREFSFRGNLSRLRGEGKASGHLTYFLGNRHSYDGGQRTARPAIRGLLTLVCSAYPWPVLTAR
jgi:hypothetical protein